MEHFKHTSPHRGNIYCLFSLYLHALGDLSIHLILVRSNLTCQILITSEAKRPGALSMSGKDKEWFCCVDHPSIPEVSAGFACTVLIVHISPFTVSKPWLILCLLRVFIRHLLFDLFLFLIPVFAQKQFLKLWLKKSNISCLVNPYLMEYFLSPPLEFYFSSVKE